MEGPCSRFYNSTFLESLTTPAPLNPALSANRLASQDRRRPVRPAKPLNRQPQPQPQPQLPPEQIPQELLDLQNFGQSSPPSPGLRSRVPPSLPRRQQDQFQSGRIQPEEKESFFNNLRGSISQARDQQPTRSFTRPPLRRPAAPAPAVEDTPRFAPTTAPSSGSGFGRRRQPLRQRQRADSPDLLSQVEAELLRREQQQKEVQEEQLRREQQQREVQAELLRREQQQKEVQEELLRREQQKKEVQAELLRREQQQREVEAELLRREQQKKEVEAELLRREQQQREVEAELKLRREQEEAANLGPSDLDSLLSRRRPVRPARPSLPSRSSLRRAPVSRGGVGLQQRRVEGEEARRGAARGRLEVLDIRRPPLQPQPGEDQADFETNFNSFRQRNSG